MDFEKPNTVLGRYLTMICMPQDEYSGVRKAIEKEYQNVQGDGASTLEEDTIKTRTLLVWGKLMGAI